MINFYPNRHLQLCYVQFATSSTSIKVLKTLLIGLVVLGAFASKSLAQSPNISYSSPQTFGVGHAIAPLSPNNVGGAVPANIYGQVSTFAGSGASGNINGTGTAASFAEVRGVACDAAGNVYVADEDNELIRKITSAGLVSTFAGSGATGDANGKGTTASFDDPKAVAVDLSGNVYVGPGGLRKISPVGYVTTFGGAVGGKGLATDKNGNIYAANEGDAIYKTTPGDVSTKLYTSAALGYGVAVDTTGNVYFSDDGVIKKLTPANVVSVLAGGAANEVDGKGTAAGFDDVETLTIDEMGNLYAVDDGAIRKITPDGTVTTVAGLAGDNGNGFVNAVGTAARFNNPYGITVDNSGNLYIGDTNNEVVRKITITGYTISPALPKGLIFDSSTGTISGTPTAASPATDYTVTANNASGSSSAVVNIKVIIPSTNSHLSSFKISKGVLTPVFSPDTTTYAANVVNGVTSFTITPTTADPAATVKVNGVAVVSGTASAAIPLAVGTHTIITKVTAQDGVTITTYNLTITRAPSNNANLSLLKLSAGALSPIFTPATTTYQAAVANGVSSVKVTPSTVNAAATIKVNGVAVASGSATAAINLNIGANTITIVVTAQDGITKKTYTVTITRAPSTNDNLVGLKLSGATLSPAFTASGTSYTADVANSTNSVTVTPTTTDPDATVTVNGATVASGTASGTISLAVGSNTIATVVTAQDGATTKTYTVTITRASGSADSDDSGISVLKPEETPGLDDIIVVHQAVSANGDGINDFLQIDGIQAFPDNKLSIMNRSGQLIYQANGYDNSSKVFDGHSNKNGQMQLPGTYFYELDYTVKGITKTKTGFIVLKY